MINKIRKDVSLVRRQSAEGSILNFAMVYLGHHLTTKPSAAHLGVYKTLQEISKKRDMRYVLAAPRDFGKSTMITLVYVLYSICYRKESFIVLMSNTSKLATGILDNVKNELLTNSLLREDFPELFEFKGEPKPPRWTRSEIETRTGIKVMAIGVGEGCRGLRYKEYRPTLIICDDLEKGDAYSSIESIEKVKDWFGKSIRMLGSPATNIIMLGTFFHPYCVIGELLNEEKNPDWRKEIISALVAEPENTEVWQQWSNILNGRGDYEGEAGPEAAKAFYMANKEAMDKGGESIWPQRWDVYKLKGEQDENPLVFSSERQNKPMDRKTQIFKLEELRLWNDYCKNTEDQKKLLEDVTYSLSCDPATGKGDYSAIIIVARDNDTGALYVVEADIRRRSVDETINDIVAFAQRYNLAMLVIEANGFQQIMADQLRGRLTNAGIYPNIVEVKNSSHKVERIQSLQSVTRAGILQFDRRHTLLIQQLTLFPMEKYDDGPDALEMLVRHIQNPPPGKSGVSCIKLNSPKSPVLRDELDLRPGYAPRVYNNRDKKELFVPDPNDY